MLGSTTTIRNPYPVYRNLQQASPIRHTIAAAGAINGPSAPRHAWALLRHREVMAAIRDSDAFSAMTPQLQGSMPRLGLVRGTRPHRTHLWSLVSGACFEHVGALAAKIQQIAVEVLDAVGRGPVEFMTACAVPLSTRLMVEALGFPGEDAHLFKPWCAAAISYSSMPSQERPHALQEFTTYMDAAIAARRAEPTNDLLSALITADIEGQLLPDHEIRSALMGVIISSSEGSANLLGNMMALLADRPDLWRRAREDRSLVEPIVEEVLRYESPVQYIRRMTTRPVEVSGVEIPAGELVELYCGAANRDPEVFEDPDLFWPERPTTREHLSLGRGSRYCAGAPMVRLVGRITLDALLDRFSTLARDADAPMRQQVARVTLGYISLPLVL
ncbi:cytochrome P450 [Sorangium sp. So ce1128]